MTRMESIRNQYQGASVRQPEPGNGGRGCSPRPRNVGWKWFWLVLLLAVLGSFFGYKGTLSDWLRKKGVLAERKDQPVSLASLSEAGQGTHQGANQEANAAEKINAKSFHAFVEPTKAELNQLCEYVRNAPNVRENLQYSEVMAGVQFFYDSTNDEVNAYATLRQLDPSKDELTRIIVFQAGAARFGRVAALAVAAELCGDKGASKRFVAAMTRRDLAQFSEAVAARIVSQAGLARAFGNDAVLAKAKSVSAGLMLGVVAHEAGHQALGHVLNTAHDNLEISRNQEREADSFESSVIASSPFGEYILVGALFWHYALAQQQGEAAVATTHPLSKERFENFVRANAELAASMGITVS